MSAKLISIEEARSRVLAEALPLSAETVPLPDALGSVLAEEIIASHSVPPFDNSGMDGYAVRAADIVDATAESPARLAHLPRLSPPGTWRPVALAAGEAARIMTGAPMPPGADAVAQSEITAEDDGYVLVYEPVKPGKNIRRAGEDVWRATGCSRPARILGPAEIGRARQPGASHRSGAPPAAGGHHLHGQRTGGGRPAAGTGADPQLQQLLAPGAVPADWASRPMPSASSPTTTRPPAGRSRPGWSTTCCSLPAASRWASSTSSRTCRTSWGWSGGCGASP